MSFLLDALRKSEQSGRRRSAPTIHSPLPEDAGRSTTRGDEGLPILAFSAPAFLLMCWFGLQMFEVGPFGAGDGPRVAAQPADYSVQADPGAEPAASMGEAETNSPPRSSAPQFVGAGTVEKPQARTPVESLQESPGRSAQPSRDPRSDRAGAQQEDPLEAASRAIQQAMAESEATPARSPQPKPSQKPGQQPAAAPRTQPEQAQPTPERQNHIDYWELPDNVRNQLPEFRVSVTVYDEMPEERFILINGRRLYEGEELQPGLVLSEVRREGPIFSFRRYRFMYTQ